MVVCCYPGMFGLTRMNQSAVVNKGKVNPHLELQNIKGKIVSKSEQKNKKQVYESL